MYIHTYAYIYRHVYIYIHTIFARVHKYTYIYIYIYIQYFCGIDNWRSLIAIENVNRKNVVSPNFAVYTRIYMYVYIHVSFRVLQCAAVYH